MSNPWSMINTHNPNPQELRTTVEERIQTLLKDELEESLNNLGGWFSFPKQSSSSCWWSSLSWLDRPYICIAISRDPDLPPFLSDPDSPIEDIDLPVNGPGVLRPGVSRLGNGNVHRACYDWIIFRAANFLCKDKVTLISIDWVSFIITLMWNEDIWKSWWGWGKLQWWWWSCHSLPYTNLSSEVRWKEWLSLDGDICWRWRWGELWRKWTGDDDDESVAQKWPTSSI